MKLEQIVEPKNNRFCSYCGDQMIEQLLGAEENIQYYGDYPTGSIANKYDSKTGERNYCYKYTCPKFQKFKWWQPYFSPHDDYFEDEIIKV